MAVGRYNFDNFRRIDKNMMNTEGLQLFLLIWITYVGHLV